MKLNEIDKFTQESSAKHVVDNHITYPDERLVAFLQRSFGDKQKNGTKRGLDIGYGSGRHLQLLLDYGFKTYGIEYTDEARAVTVERFKYNNDLQGLFAGDYRTFDFKVNFDVLIAWGVVFYSTFSEIKSDLSSLSNIIKDDGRIFINFRTKDNWFNGLGKEIDKNSYLLDERAGVYKNYMYTFLDYEEIKEVIIEAGLKIEGIERMDLWKNQLTERNSWYICELSKK